MHAAFALATRAPLEKAHADHGCNDCHSCNADDKPEHVIAIHFGKNAETTPSKPAWQEHDRCPNHRGKYVCSLEACLVH